MLSLLNVFIRFLLNVIQNFIEIFVLFFVLLALHFHEGGDHELDGDLGELHFSVIVDLVFEIVDGAGDVHELTGSVHLFHYLMSEAVPFADGANE